MHYASAKRRIKLSENDISLSFLITSSVTYLCAQFTYINIHHVLCSSSHQSTYILFILSSFFNAFACIFLHLIRCEHINNAFSYSIRCTIFCLYTNRKRFSIHGVPTNRRKVVKLSIIRRWENKFRNRECVIWRTKRKNARTEKFHFEFCREATSQVCETYSTTYKHRAKLSAGITYTWTKIFAAGARMAQDFTIEAIFSFEHTHTHTCDITDTRYTYFAFNFLFEFLFL